MSGLLVVRAGPVSVRTTWRALLVCSALALLVVALATWAMTLGSAAVGLTEVWAVLAGGGDDGLRRLVLHWRAPRVVAAVVFGALLAVGGAVFQSLTRNPLGSPDIIGFSTGAYTGVVVTMWIGLTGYLAIAAGALVGGLLTAFLVYLLAFRHGVQGFRLIIVGIAVGAVMSAFTSWFTVKVDVDLALRAAVWGAGSLGAADWPGIAAGLLALALVAAVGPIAQRRMRRLELGDDAAAMLGVPVEPTKLGLVVLGVIVTAVVTAAAGPIAFVALAAPQIARRLTGRGASVDLATSAAVGAALLLLADVVAQHAVPDNPIPTGAVTVCLGGVYLVWLLARESARTSGVS